MQNLFHQPSTQRERGLHPIACPHSLAKVVPSPALTKKWFCPTPCPGFTPLANARWSSVDLPRSRIERDAVSCCTVAASSNTCVYSRDNRPWWWHVAVYTRGRACAHTFGTLEPFFEDDSLAGLLDDWTQLIGGQRRFRHSAFSSLPVPVCLYVSLCLSLCLSVSEESVRRKMHNYECGLGSYSLKEVRSSM